MPTAYWAGGASGAETDTNNAANWVDAANGTNPFGSVPDGNDDVVIQSTSNSNVSHNPTQTAAHTFNSILLEAGSQWTADGTNHLTLNGENGNDFAFRIISATYVHSNGTIVVNNGGGVAHAAIAAGIATSTNGIYDLTISGGGTTCEIYGDTTIHRNMEAGGSTTVLRGALTVNGNLTVEGTLNTRYSSTDRNLTVLGALDVGSSGALTCNSSTVQCNGLRTTGGTVNLPDASGSFTVKGTEFSGYGIYDRAGSGNIVHNGGTVTWDTGGMSTMYALSTFNNIVTATSGTTLRWLSTLTLAGTLTVAANTTVKEHSSAGGNFTVAGDVTVSGTLGDSDAYSEYFFGSLRVETGGAYNATSGTTTITKYASTGKAIYANGPMAHNGGTFAFTNTDNYGSIQIQLEGGAGDAGAQFNDVNFSGDSTYRVPYYGMGAGITISGDVTISDTVEVKQWRRDMVISGNLTINSGSEYDCNGSGVAGVDSEFTAGSLTISAGGTFSPSPQNNTITTGAFNITTNSFDLGANTLNFTGTNASFLSATNASFSAGPGATITGKAADDKTDFDCQKNFQVVGDVNNLNNNGPGSLMVTGKVINCDGNIIQLKPTQDSEQQLDKSSEADRETTLGRDLDGNTELVG